MLCRIQDLFATSNQCIASSNKCLASSNKKLQQDTGKKGRNAERKKESLVHAAAWITVAEVQMEEAGRQGALRNRSK